MSADERKQLAAALKHAMTVRLNDPPAGSSSEAMGAGPGVGARTQPSKSAGSRAMPKPSASKRSPKPSLAAGGRLLGSISFNAAMLRAVLAGAKTQTRRPIRPAPTRVSGGVPLNADGSAIQPIARVGDRLWVRESWARAGEGFIYASDRHSDGAGDRAGDRPSDRPSDRPDDRPDDGLGERSVRWVSSRFMPRDAARTFLDVKSVRIQRLASIDEADVLAEGIEIDSSLVFDPRAAFFTLWDSIYGQTEFATKNNPWVWTIDFECKAEKK